MARFRRVLRAAQRTPRYQPLLEGAGLATAEALAGIDSVSALWSGCLPLSWTNSEVRPRRSKVRLA